MKNILRKLKLIFRKPRVGELWSMDHRGRTEIFEVIKKESRHVNAMWYCTYYTFKFNDGWAWEGPISQAGPIYLAKNNSLAFGLDSLGMLPKPNSITVEPPTRRF